MYSFLRLEADDCKEGGSPSEDGSVGEHSRGSSHPNERVVAVAWQKVQLNKAE